MADGLPSASDFFGVQAPPPTSSQDSQLPSAEDFFGQSDKMVGSYPNIGVAHDAFWSAPFSAYGRILNSAGYGAQQAWGTTSLGLTPEDEAQFRKMNLFNNYAKGENSLLKSANEAIIRPAAAAVDLVTRALKVPFYEVAGGYGQTAQEIQGEHPTALRTALATPFGAVGEVAGAIPQGFVPEFGAFPHAGEASSAGSVAPIMDFRAAEAARARAVGVLGEGEAGYHEVLEPTPEKVQARLSAAKEADVPVVAPPPPPPDIHALARSVDPETFQKYDALAIQKDQARNQIEKLSVEREQSPEVRAASTELDDILQGQDATHIESVFDENAPIRKRLDAAQNKLDALLRTDTPEMAATRKALLDADFAQQDLVRDVAAAYRQARDMIPEQKPETVAENVSMEQNVPQGENETAPSAQSTAEKVPSEQASQGTGVQPLPSAAETGTKAVQEVPRIEHEGVAQEAESGTPSISDSGRTPSVEGTGELKERGLAKGVRAKALEDGILDTFGDVPKYRALNMEDQAAKASDIIKSDYEAAKAMAMGERAPPKDVLPATMFVAVEKHALAIGDAETIRQLGTKSRLLEEATEAGRTIRTYGERDPDSPVKAIQEVQKAREEAFGKRNKTDAAKAKASEVAAMKSEIRKTASTKSDWKSFISSIECS